MAIAFDAATGSNGSSVSSLTWSHTTSSGSNRILFVSVAEWDSTKKVTGVTYAGVSMTEIDSQQVAASNPWITLYYLVAPATGANNVVVSASGSMFQIQGSSASYTGVSQTGIPDSKNKSAYSSSTTQAISTTVVASNCWLFMGVVNDSSDGITAGTGTTRRDIRASAEAVFDSNGTVGTGSQSLTFVTPAGGHEGAVIISFKPVAPVTGNGFFALVR